MRDMSKEAPYALFLKKKEKLLVRALELCIRGVYNSILCLSIQPISYKCSFFVFNTQQDQAIYFLMFDYHLYVGLWRT